MTYISNSEFIFPKQIILSDSINFLSYKDKLIEMCYQEKRIDPKGVRYSNVGGWQSKSNYIHHDKKFEFLFEDIFANIMHCMYNEFNFAEDKVSQIQITNSWINISGQNNYNQTHTHPLSVLSGVYYVKCPSNCGNIVFVQNDNECSDLEYQKKEIKNLKKMHYSHLFVPVEGRLILFPSSLRHYVELNKSCDDRISISFNISIF
jgi:uncharacterized protein (TIGR02466 family)